MLSQVFSNHQDQPIKPVEVRYLSMGTNDIPVDNTEKAELLEELNRSPERSFTTTWVSSYGALFWVDVTIVGPVTEESKCDLTLRRSKTQGVDKAISHIVEFLKEKLG